MTKNIYEQSCEHHAKYQGKIAIQSKVPLETQHHLSLAYTPGVAEPCLEISKNEDLAYAYTSKKNLVAVATDGSAVLGLGNIGPTASLPVMEGKAILFKKFADVDAVPICVNTQDIEKFIETIVHIAPGFGGINLEDIAAPRCFEIERRLDEMLDIPVFHDDQHGTAVVVLAALINSLKLVKKSFSNLKVVINGAGAAGYAIVKLLNSVDVKDIVILDRSGIIYEGRKENMNPFKEILALETNRSLKKGDLAEAMKGTDLFIGVSQPNCVTVEMVQSMAKDPIIMALSNPTPEIMPEEAKKGGAKVICTGRSDFPNQVNNALVFPAIFRGALDCFARTINQEMKIAAADALASLISPEELRPDFVIPTIFDQRIVDTVSKSVIEAARRTGVCKEIHHPTFE